MIPNSRRGQTESSFQWIFVLVAGIALLLLLLGFARSCTTAGDAAVRQGDAQAAASRLSSVAWEGNAKQEISLPDATIACRAGTISVEMEAARATLDRVPIYLPPTVGGDATVVTRAIALGERTPAPFPLGGVAFVLDDRTVYFLVDDAAGAGTALWDTLPSSPSLVRITVADLNRASTLDIPGSPRTMVFAIVGEEASLANVDISGLPGGVEVRGVALKPDSSTGGRATFYTSDGETLVAGTSIIPYAHETMALGMVIAADREVAWCATTAFALRARMLVRIAEMRATMLSSHQDTVCGATLGEAATLLRGMRTPPGDAAFLSGLFASERAILVLQNTLLSRPGSCPGVA